MKYTQAECEALDRKLEHPEETVVCPRCGKSLEYTARNGSCMVKCQTDGCLRDGIRGF